MSLFFNERVVDSLWGTFGVIPQLFAANTQVLHIQMFLNFCYSCLDVIIKSLFFTYFFD